MKRDDEYRPHVDWKSAREIKKEAKAEIRSIIKIVVDEGSQ